MNRILHQLKRDLVHQRWALTGWATLLLMHLLLSGFQILRHVPNPQPSTEDFALMVASWVVFLPLLFVILAVQSDSPVGSSAFWMTRPLRGRQMLAAKALFVVLLFVILPLSIEIIILLLRGAGEMTWLLLPEFSVVRLPVVLAAFALGAATQRFLHALTLAAIGSAISMLSLILGSYIFFGGLSSSMTQPFAGSRGIAGLWALAATFSAVVVVQFLTRREGLSRGLFLAGIVGTTILQMIWPWDILNRSPQQDVRASSEVELRIAPASVSFGTVQNSSQRGTTRSVSLPIEIGSGSLAAGEFLAPVSSRMELVAATSSYSPRISRYGVDPADQNYRAALESMFSPDGITLISPLDRGTVESRPQPLSHSFEMDDVQFDRLSRDLKEIRMVVDVGEFEFELAGELPLHDGAKWQAKGDELEIVHSRATGKTLYFNIHEQQLSLMFSARNAQGRHRSYPWVLVLVNSETKTAILLNRIQGPMKYRGTTWISPFLRGEEKIDVNLRQALRRDITPEAADRWLEDSTLVIVRRRYLGSVPVESVVDAASIRRRP